MRWAGEHRAALEKAYRGKAVSVTGAAGFIGGHLAEALLVLGARVSMVDDLSTSDGDHAGSLVDMAPERVALVIGSILDPAALEDAMVAPDTVFHLASVSSVGAAEDDPERSFDVNARGTLRVAEHARKAGARRLIYAASSSAYGDGAPPCVETAPPSPLSVYAATKLAGEHIVSAWARARGLPGLSLRLFNVYGPRQRPGGPYGAVIPAFCTRILSGKPPVINGDGAQTRDFVHVSDVVRAFLLAGMAEAPALQGGPVNIGSGRPISILELARLMTGLAGREGLIPVHEAPRLGDPQASHADVALAARLLGFKAAASIEDGLRELIDSCTQGAPVQTA